MGTGTQYGLVVTQHGAVNLQFKPYKEMTNKMDVNRQATKVAIAQRNQVIQSQQLTLQAFYTNQFVNQQQWADMGN
jgi:hypothetical protein